MIRSATDRQTEPISVALFNNVWGQKGNQIETFKGQEIKSSHSIICFPMFFTNTVSRYIFCDRFR